DLPVNVSGERSRGARAPSFGALGRDARPASSLHKSSNESTRFTTHSGGNEMLSTILIVILVLILIGALPTWPYSGGWGFYPSGGLGVILLIVIVLALTGRL